MIRRANLTVLLAACVSGWTGVSPATETLNNLSAPTALGAFQCPGPGIGFGRVFTSGAQQSLLTSVTLEQMTFSPPSSAFQVRILKVDDRSPVPTYEPVCTLVNPQWVAEAGDADLVQYSPAEPFLLLAGTRYVVAATEVPEGAPEVYLAFTGSEDYTAATGWSLGDDLLMVAFPGLEIWMPDPGQGHMKFRLDTEPLPNSPPDVSKATCSVSVLWPPNGKMVPFEVLGVTDPDGDPVTIQIDAILQDEPVRVGPGDKAAPDAAVKGPGKGVLRAERLGNGNGRVYAVFFTASDGFPGSGSSGVVYVTVPHSMNGVPAVDDGEQYDSTK